MSIQRSYLRQLMLSLFDKEVSYDAGPAAWAAANACSMIEFSGESVVEWDDRVRSNADVIGSEFATKQEISRQSMRLNYVEPRLKPNTLAGLGALTLGTVASVQDGALAAYRHKLTPANIFALPSIGAQAKHDSGRQYVYKGLKSDGLKLTIAEDYFSLSSLLIGSGTRATAADAFAASISESWLRSGDAKVYVKATSGTPITVPAAPTQGSANLGGSEVNLTSVIKDNLSLAWQNNLGADLGYRVGSALVRSQLHGARRTEGSDITLSIECDSADEAAHLDRYLNQTKLAFEINCDSGTIIAATGVFKFGFIVIVPQLQFRSLARSEESEREDLDYACTIMNDGTNDPIVMWVYNAQAAYLA